MKIENESLKIVWLIAMAVIFYSVAVGVDASELNVNFVYTETGLRDPFAPSDYEHEDPGPTDSNDFLSQKSLKLEGIMWDPVDPYIIINDECFVKRKIGGAYEQIDSTSVFWYTVFGNICLFVITFQP